MKTMFIDDLAEDIAPAGIAGTVVVEIIIIGMIL